MREIKFLEVCRLKSHLIPYKSESLQKATFEMKSTWLKSVCWQATHQRRRRKREPLKTFTCLLQMAESCNAHFIWPNKAWMTRQIFLCVSWNPDQTLIWEFTHSNPDPCDSSANLLFTWCCMWREYEGTRWERVQGCSLPCLLCVWRNTRDLSWSTSIS